MTTTINPVEIDTRIAALSAEYHAAADAYTSAVDLAHRCLGERPIRRTRNAVMWATNDTDTVAALKTAVAAGTLVYHDRQHADRALARIADAEATMARVRPQIDELEDLWREHRWSRFVTVEAGHIHSGTVCAGGTIRPSTRIGWNPELSGTTEADAVAKLGPTLCTHCFPTAPVEWTRGHDKPVDPTICDSVELTEAQRKAWNPRRVSSYVRCGCGADVSVTRTGRKRKHKRGDLGKSA